MCGARDARVGGVMSREGREEEEGGVREGGWRGGVGRGGGGRVREDFLLLLFLLLCVDVLEQLHGNHSTVLPLGSGCGSGRGL